MDNNMIHEQANPLIQRVKMPGESFTLPSRCSFYNDGEVSDKCKRTGEIHIHPMTAVDEIVMRSPDKILSGDAVTEVFSRCIPDILQPELLLQRDVDFLVAALRKVSYGDEFDVSHRHDCEGAEDHEYRINMSTMLQQTRSIDPTTINSIFQVKLDNGQVVEIEPIRYREVLLLMQTLNEPDITFEQQQVFMLESLVRVILRVDEIEDKQQIAEWIKTIPVKWSKKLSEAIDKSADWGPDFEVAAKCKDCGGDLVIQAPMNPISFFT